MLVFYESPHRQLRIECMSHERFLQLCQALKLRRIARGKHGRVRGRFLRMARELEH